MSAIPAIGSAPGATTKGAGAPGTPLDSFKLGSLTLSSRLILGTARYPNHDILLRALKAGGADMVTVAIRRVNLDDPTGENLLSLLQRHRFTLLPNTAGCHTVRDAILTAELAREALETNFIKLEIIADEDTLYPDAEKLLDAARQLVAKGFEVLPYCIDDPITCKKLEDIGCVAVMPLGAPIGSGMGILNPYNFNLIREKVRVPMIVDAGIGTASDVALAMELGCDAALVDTAVAHAVDSVVMADAMRLAVEAGHKARLAGRIPKKNMAQASSPASGLIQPKRRTG